MNNQRLFELDQLQLPYQNGDYGVITVVEVNYKSLVCTIIFVKYQTTTPLPNSDQNSDQHP